MRYCLCMTTGSRIKQARLDAGHSIAGLARLLGCTSSAVHGWERGERRPGDPVLHDVARVCRVSVTWLQAGRLTAAGSRALRQVQRLPVEERHRVIGILTRSPADPSPDRV